MKLDIDAELAVCEAATPGPWKLWDGCSWRRFGCEAQDEHWYGKHVILPTTDRHDGMPDLVVEKRDAEFICHARTVLPEALRRLKRLQDIINHCCEEERESGEEGALVTSCRFIDALSEIRDILI